MSVDSVTKKWNMQKRSLDVIQMRSSISTVKSKFLPVRMTAEGTIKEDAMPETPLVSKIKFSPIRMPEGFARKEENSEPPSTQKMKFLPVRISNVNSDTKEFVCSTRKIQFLPVRLTEADLRPESHKKTSATKPSWNSKKNQRNSFGFNIRQSYSQHQTVNIPNCGLIPNRRTSNKMSYKNNISNESKNDIAKIAQLNIAGKLNASKKPCNRNLFNDYTKKFSPISESSFESKESNILKLNTIMTNKTRPLIKKLDSNCSEIVQENLIDDSSLKKKHIDASCQTDFENDSNQTSNIKQINSMAINTENVCCFCPDCPNNTSKDNLISSKNVIAPVINQKHNRLFKNVILNQNFERNLDSSLTEFIQFESMIRTPQTKSSGIILNEHSSNYEVNNKKILDTKKLIPKKGEDVFNDNKENCQPSNNCSTRTSIETEPSLSICITPDNLISNCITDKNALIFETPNILKNRQMHSGSGKKEVKAKKVLKMYVDMKNCNPNILETPQVNWKKHGEITFVNNKSKISQVLLNQIKDIVATPQK